MRCKDGPSCSRWLTFAFFLVWEGMEWWETNMTQTEWQETVQRPEDWGHCWLALGSQHADPHRPSMGIGSATLTAPPMPALDTCSPGTKQGAFLENSILHHHHPQPLPLLVKGPGGTSRSFCSPPPAAAKKQKQKTEGGQPSLSARQGYFSMKNIDASKITKQQSESGV